MTHFKDLTLDDRLCLLVLAAFSAPTIAPAERKSLFHAVHAAANRGAPGRGTSTTSFEAVLGRIAGIAPPTTITVRYTSRRKLWFAAGPPAITAVVHRITDPCVRAGMEQALDHDDDVRRLAQLMLAEALDEPWVVEPTRPLHAEIAREGENRRFVRPHELDDPQALMERVCADIPDNHMLDAALSLLARHPGLADDTIVDRLEALSRRTEEHIPYSLATHLAPISRKLPAGVTLILLRLALHTGDNIGAAMKPIAEMILARHDAMDEPAGSLARRAFRRILAAGDPRPAGTICNRIADGIRLGAFPSSLLATYPEILATLARSSKERTRGCVADTLHSCPEAAHYELADLRRHLEQDTSPYVRDCLRYGQLKASAMPS